jgi:N-acetylmuramoyl-L-alanine amidase
MKIVVFNLHKHQHAFKGIKIIAIMLALFILGSLFINLYIGSDRFISAISQANDNNLIIIDAGHGGEDCGAIGVTGVYEKDLNFAMAYEIGSILEEHGFTVLYTRTEDKLLYTDAENIKGLRKISDLKNRCKIAAEYPNSLFISVHMNSYGDSKYSGLQVYYSENNSYSKTLAGSVQSNVKESLQPSNNRVIKPGENIYILENVENPAILIECGFLTNSEECKKLSEKEYQKQLSLAIVCGIIKYKERITSY